MFTYLAILTHFPMKSIILCTQTQRTSPEAQAALCNHMCLGLLATPGSTFPHVVLMFSKTHPALSPVFLLTATEGWEPMDFGSRCPGRNQSQSLVSRKVQQKTQHFNASFSSVALPSLATSSAGSVPTRFTANKIRAAQSKQNVIFTLCLHKANPQIGITAAVERQTPCTTYGHLNYIHAHWNDAWLVTSRGPKALSEQPQRRSGTNLCLPAGKCPLLHPPRTALQRQRKKSKQRARLFRYLTSELLTTVLFLPSGHDSRVGTTEKFHEDAAKATAERAGEVLGPRAPHPASHRDGITERASVTPPNLSLR